MKSRAFAVAMSAGLALGACDVGRSSSPPATTATNPTVGRLEANAVVERVIDGDTVDVRIGGSVERVRLIGIDTPETKRPDHPVECYGPEATAFTEQLLTAGTSVHLERDVVGRDDYGRLLAYLYRADDGIFVNYEVMRQGYGQPLSIPPNDTYAELFADAARAAEADDAGLWAACSG